MSKLHASENFAKERHSGMTGKDGITPYHEHLASVVARLKNLGIADEDVISSSWLHDIIDHTETSFDELDQRFGSKVAVLVLSVSRDKSLPRAKQEEQYVKQLKGMSFEAKLIKLCDISASLRDLKNSSFSKTKKTKEVKKMAFHLSIIKSDLIKNKSQFPGIVSLINGINDMISAYGQRPIVLQ
ncbi:HD domain-containing protein [Candidatus Nitrosotalea bavarica]|uniref:HD domain-containing protein n=1 Tax=Candidatus Nitrosotalea bavarica TaxID=1903277 RepID=UPI000C714583|nr:HD domain-containing protein [Candidatus Nitrosotalea bavarica]